jgi:hypothetical protein
MEEVLKRWVGVGVGGDRRETRGNGMGATFTAIMMVIMAAEKLQFSKIQIYNLGRSFSGDTII